MGQSVEVVVSELHSAAGRLQDAGQRLQDGLSRVDLETSQLLGSGWKGDAASAFSKAWEQWHGGAGQIVRGLQTMSQLLTVAGKEYAKTDEQAAGAIGSSGQAMDGSGGGAPGGQGAALVSNAQGASAAGAGQPTRSLAQQMNLAPPSQIGQIGGQVTAGLGQAAQAAAGLVQRATEAAAGSAPENAPSAATPVEQPAEGPQTTRGGDEATETRRL